MNKEEKIIFNNMTPELVIEYLKMQKHNGIFNFKGEEESVDIVIKALVGLTDYYNDQEAHAQVTLEFENENE